jgi:maleylacetoacetate isomerase
MSAEPEHSPEPDLVLYHYWRSSAAYRVRIALNLKGLPYKVVPVHLVKDGGQQHQPSFLAINPQGLVPVLLRDGQAITQSMAICEYLDECYKHKPLLPKDPLQRARIRALTLSIACDIHPLNNLRVVKYLQKRFDGDFDQMAWMQHWMSSGFQALEWQLDPAFGAGDNLSTRPGLFECFLIPQVYNAERFELDMLPYPQIMKIVEHCRSLPEFVKAKPENQPDAA